MEFLLKIQSQTLPDSMQRALIEALKQIDGIESFNIQYVDPYFQVYLIEWYCNGESECTQLPEDRSNDWLHPQGLVSIAGQFIWQERPVWVTPRALAKSDIAVTARTSRGDFLLNQYFCEQGWFQALLAA